MAKEAEELEAQAQRLRELKKMARGVTFGQIAGAVGVTERQVQRWFAGDSDIDGGRLKTLARFLGTTPDYIEYGTTERKRRPTPELPAARNGTGRGSPDLAALQQQLDRIEALLSQQLTGQQLAEKFDLASVEQASRVEAILQRLARAEETIQASLRQRPA